MITTGEWIGFGLGVAGALALVTAMLANRAAAAGQEPSVIRHRIVAIWGCVLGAIAAGFAARMLMGGYGVDFDVRDVRLVVGASKLWPAILALGIILILMVMAMRQIRLLTSASLQQAEDQDSEND